MGTSISTQATAIFLFIRLYTQSPIGYIENTS